MPSNFPLCAKRYRYFQQIAKLVPSKNLQLVIVTHLVLDRPELFASLSQIATISLVVAIPYSLEQCVHRQLATKYKIITPSLEELSNSQYLEKVVLQSIDNQKPLVILEIGGYFAHSLLALHKKLKNNFIGVIEDTETGHRRYEALTFFPCPVISVARSALKRSEDSLIGDACLFSTEKLIRKTGYLIDCKNALVLGFGKVGAGTARVLSNRHCHVAVYDNDPVKRVTAISEGFFVPSKIEALQQADIIFGATGLKSLTDKDFRHVKNGAILASCSSKDIEFDMRYLEANYKREDIFPSYTKYTKDDRHLYVLANGRPVNFLDGSPLGPVLALVQSEIILAIREIVLLGEQKKCGLFELGFQDRKMLATIWLKHFCDPKTGYYS
jgi:adenosylhomocysteinase